MKKKFKAILFLFSVISLTVIFSLCVGSNQSVLFALIIAILLFLIAVPILLRICKRQFDIFEPIVIFAILYLFFHVIKSIDIYYFGSNIVTPKSFQSNITAIGYALIGYIFFMIGYYLRLGRVIGQKIPVVSKHEDYNNVIFIYSGMMIAGIVSLVVLTYEGGFVNYITFLNARAKFFSQRGIYYYLLLFMPTAFLLWYTFSVTREFLFKKGLTAILFLLSLAGTACTGSRLNVALLILGTVIIRHYMYKKVNFKFMSFVGIVMIVFLIFGGYLRRQGSGFIEKVKFGMEKDTVSPNIFVNAFHLAARGFYPHEELILLIDNMPERLNFQYGKSYMSIAFHFIPRAIMGRDRNMELNMGRLFTSAFFPEAEKGGLVTFSPGLLGEGYMNFHISGIIMSMFMLGVFYRGLYAYLKLGETSKQRVLIYSIALPVMAKIIKGGFVAGIKLFIGFLVPIVIGVFFIEHCRHKKYSLI